MASDESNIDGVVDVEMLVQAEEDIPMVVVHCTAYLESQDLEESRMDRSVDLVEGHMDSQKAAGAGSFEGVVACVVADSGFRTVFDGEAATVGSEWSAGGLSVSVMELQQSLDEL